MLATRSSDFNVPRDLTRRVGGGAFTLPTNEQELRSLFWNVAFFVLVLFLTPR
jgi:hypothetical protein